MSTSKSERSIRLVGKTTAELDRTSGATGEIFYDSSIQSLRIFSGAGASVNVATRNWVTANTFNGNYNNLTNKPAIPSLSGYATESYVTTRGYITNTGIPSQTGQSGKYLTTNGIAVSWASVTATASSVGLGNVTNESKATMFASPTFTGTVAGVTATHVGLGNVTNESKATMFTSPTFTGTVAAFSSATHTLTASSNLVFTGSSSGSVTLQAGATPAAQTYTLPAAYPGVNGYALVSTTGGVLSWAAAGGGGGTTTNALTIGTGLTGTSFNGSSAVTIALGTSGASAGTYGNNYSSGSFIYMPQFTVDTYGRITSVTTNYVAMAGGNNFAIIYAGAAGTVQSPTVPSGTQVSASGASDSLYLIAGSGITITANDGAYNAIMISAGAGAGLTWVYGAYATSSISLTAPTGVTTSGNQLWVAVLGQDLSSGFINSVTCNGYAMTMKVSGGPNGGNMGGMVLYSINTGSSLTTSVNISLSGYAGYPMATCWVTTSNSANSTSATTSTSSSSSVVISNNPSYTKGPGRVIFMSTTSSVNMTTAISSPPAGWTAEGTAQHPSSSSLTAAVFKAPDPWTNTASFSTSNASFNTIGYGLALNS